MTLDEGDRPRWWRSAAANERVRLSGTLWCRGLQCQESTHRERAKTGERPGLREYRADIIPMLQIGKASNNTNKVLPVRSYALLH